MQDALATAEGAQTAASAAKWDEQYATLKKKVSASTVSCLQSYPCVDKAFLLSELCLWSQVSTVSEMYNKFIACVKNNMWEC